VNLESFKYFYPERPRLLHIEQPLFERLSQDRDWVAESKYNGSRLQLHHANAAWQFWNRHEELMAYAPSPDVLDALGGLNLSGYWLFDGELRHGKTKGVRHQIVLYDVFIMEGELLLNKPFGERRGILETLLHYLGDYHVLSLPEQYPEEFRQVFDRVTRDEEIEGLVLKNVKGRLRLGRTRAAESSWMWKVRKPSGRYQF
jgi:ATP-dependent DNA ligase